MKVTNNSKALQGVHTAMGVVFIAPGETKDVELTPEGHKGVSRLSFLSVEGKAPAGDSDERAELFAKLKDLGIDAAGNSKTETLQKKLDEALAAKEHADVIAQLTAKGVEFGEKDSLEDLKAKLAAAQ